MLYNNPSYSRILIGSRQERTDARLTSSLQSFSLCRFKMAESFENWDNILCDWAKDRVQKSLAEALNRFEKPENER